ncbi:MAG: hypothetical protein CFE26_10160 [Verrucomicrobiales bacterium VVV1]|nr:MAG: hypothetical protein CFE26_10160 [Verrucomicrobiales bacterium VVV1]
MASPAFPLNRFHLHLFGLLIPAISVAAEKVTYDDQVFPLFQQSCLNCHNPDKTKGGLDLSTYSGAMKGSSGGKIAEPGDANSKLIIVCLQTGTPKMPPEGDKLGAAQISILKGWVEGGLLENKNSSAKKPSKPKFETALKSDPGAKPDGPPPVPEHLRLEPYVATSRASAIHAMAVSPWAPLLAITGQRQILLHDANTLELVGLLPFPEGDPVSLSFTPDGRYLLVGGGIPGKSGTTVTFDIRSGERTLAVGKEFDSILAADIRPGFDVVASGGPSKLLKLWNTQTGEVIASIKKHTDWITALDISPDGILVASGDRNGGVWVWEAQSGNEFHTLRAHQAAITSAVFRSDSNLLATSSEDGTVRFWELNAGWEVKKIDAHPGGVAAFAFGRDGSFVTAGRDQKVRLWKADFNLEKELAKDLPTLPTAVALASESSRAFVADAAGIVRAYDLKSGLAVGEFSAAPATIANRLAALRCQIEAQPAIISAAEGKLAESTAKLTSSQKALADTEEAVRQARTALETSKKSESSLRQQLDQQKQQLSARRGQIDQLSGEMNTVSADLEARKQALAALPEDQRRPADFVTVETRRNELDAQISRLRMELGGLEKQEKGLPTLIEAAAQSSLAAAAQLKASEDQIAARRQEIPATEKTLAEAKATLDSIKARTTGLQAAEKHWLAAAINTRALEARETSHKLLEESEEHLASFRVMAKAIEGPMQALREKRRERDEFAAQLESKRREGIEGGQLKELQASLETLNLAVETLAVGLSKAEAELAAARERIETTSPSLDEVLRAAAKLKSDYVSALK